MTDAARLLRTFLRTAAPLVAVAWLAWGGATARAQDAAPAAPPAAPFPDAAAGPRLTDTSPRGHWIRGVLAWRRAVWTSDGAAYARAARELEAARAGLGEDATLLFMLGHCRARLMQQEEADGALGRARELAPAFPGHLLGEALRLTADRLPFQKGEHGAEALAFVDRFITEMSRYDRDAPFAAELDYLGHLERGLRLFAQDQADPAIRELERAERIARAEGRPPAPELVRTLSECHKKLNQQDTAEKLLLDALRRDPGEPSNYLVVALIAAERRDSVGARTWYRRALARRLDYAEPRVKLAYLAWEVGELAEMRAQLEAFDYLQSLLPEARDPERRTDDLANLRSAWGTYWRARGDERADARDMPGAEAHWRRARDEYLIAVARNSRCMRALNGLLQVLTLLREPEKTIQPWRERIEDVQRMDPTGKDAHRDTFC